jgi:hypothetical protein
MELNAKARSSTALDDGKKKPLSIFPQLTFGSVPDKMLCCTTKQATQTNWQEPDVFYPVFRTVVRLLWVCLV